MKNVLLLLLMLLTASCCKNTAHGQSQKCKYCDAVIGSAIPLDYSANNETSPDIIYQERAPGIDIKVSKIKVPKGTLYVTTIIPRGSSNGNAVAQTFVPDSN